MITIELLLLIVPLLVLISILLIKVSTNFGMPVLLLFLAIGMLAGSEGPGGIFFDNAYLAQSIGTIALAFILFSGGLDTKWTDVKPVLWQSVSLATIGVLLTAVSVGLFAAYLLNIPLAYGLLLASVISSTDAAAVFSVLRSKNIKLKGNLKPLLELESGSNDPMAIFLTIGFIEFITAPNSSLLSFLPLFLLQMGIGGIAGFGAGLLFIYLINRLNFDYQGIYPVFTLAFILFTFGITAAFQGSGFLAVYVCGIIAGNHQFIHQKSLGRFVDGLAWLSQITMFITLGLLVNPSNLFPIIGSGILLSLFLIIVGRPISVYISLLFSKYNWREQLFISWVGLRGAVPIILATFFLIRDLEFSGIMFNIVFFSVIISAILQGWSIPLVARLLNVTAPADKKFSFPIEMDSPTEGDKDLVDFTIPTGSSAANTPIVNLGLPEGNLIVLINRDNQYVIPSGNTTLLEGDIVLVIADKKSLSDIGNIFKGD